jgi:enamine deaminase RidA (YjgF/YER057c/UK114 family)
LRERPPTPADLRPKADRIDVTGFTPVTVPAAERATRTRTSSPSPYETAYGFSRALRVGNHIHVSGTAPIEPDGTSTPGDAAAQTRRCFAIILAAIEELGGTVADVVRTRMFITDPADADAIGAVHGALFGASRPAATMVVVSGLLRPEWRIEIEAEALLGNETD